jgi:hypothetical protein
MLIGCINESYTMSIGFRVYKKIKICLIEGHFSIFAYLVCSELMNVREKSGMLVSDNTWVDRSARAFVYTSTFAYQRIIFKQFFFFLKLHLHHFSRIKCRKEVTKQEYQGFSYYFFLIIEGSGSVPSTNGSGSRRPKNIRIRNTGCNTGLYTSWVLDHQERA